MYIMLAKELSLFKKSIVDIEQNAIAIMAGSIAKYDSMIDIGEVKYEDFYNTINNYIPKISKFYINNLYNFKRANPSVLVSNFINELF